MNRIKKLLAIFILCFIVIFSSACLETDLYKVQTSGNIVSVTEYSGTVENLVTPTEIDGETINELGYSVYALNIYIKSAKITPNIIYVRSCAFWYCSYLKEVYIPKSVNIIEPYAFHGCMGLTDVYYEGTEEEFLNLFKDLEDGSSSNIELFNANIHYNYSEE